MANKSVRISWKNENSCKAATYDLSQMMCGRSKKNMNSQMMICFSWRILMNSMGLQCEKQS